MNNRLLNHQVYSNPKPAGVLILVSMAVIAVGNQQPMQAQAIGLGGVRAGDIEESVLDYPSPPRMIPYATNGQSGSNAGETELTLSNLTDTAIDILLVFRDSKGSPMELSVDTGDGRPPRLEAGLTGIISPATTIKVKTARGNQALKLGVGFLYASDPEGLAVSSLVTTGPNTNQSSFLTPAIEPLDAVALHVLAASTARSTAVTLINPLEDVQRVSLTLHEAGRVQCSGSLELSAFEHQTFDPIEKLQCGKGTEGILTVQAAEAIGILGLATLARSGELAPLPVFRPLVPADETDGQNEPAAAANATTKAAERSAKPSCVPMITPAGLTFDATESKEDMELSTDCGDNAPRKWELKIGANTPAYFLDAKGRKVTRLIVDASEEAIEFTLGLLDARPSGRGGVRTYYVYVTRHNGQKTEGSYVLKYAFKQRYEAAAK